MVKVPSDAKMEWKPHQRKPATLFDLWVGNATLTKDSVECEDNRLGIEFLQLKVYEKSI